MPEGIVTGVTGSGLVEAPTLCSMRAEVRYRLGETTEDFWLDATIDSRLNEAVKRFSMEEKWSWLYTSKTASITNGQLTLDLVSAVSPNRAFNLLVTQSGTTVPYLLRRVTPNEGFVLRQQYATGPLTWFYLETARREDVDPDPSNQSYQTVWRVKFVPPANADYSAEYQYLRVPAKMEDCDDTPDVPAEYAEAVIAWATGLCWLDELQGGAKAAEQFGIYSAVLTQAHSEDAGPAVDTVVAWGKQEPQMVKPVTEEAWMLSRIGALGP